MINNINLKKRMVRPRIGLLATGHLIYWNQLPGLKDMCMKMYGQLIAHLEKIGDVVSSRSGNTTVDVQVSQEGILNWKTLRTP